MRLILAAAAMLAAAPAAADQDSFPMDFTTCLGALAQAAQQLHLPLAFGVDTPDRKDFTIATTGGAVTMSCNRTAATLTVIAPPGVSVAPYVSTQ